MSLASKFHRIDRNKWYKTFTICILYSHMSRPFHFLPDKASRCLIQPAITICFTQLIDSSILTTVIAYRINNIIRARRVRCSAIYHDIEWSTNPNKNPSIPNSYINAYRVRNKRPRLNLHINILFRPNEILVPIICTKLHLTT